MDKNNDFQNGFSPYDGLNDLNMNDMYKDPMFNPMLQYEQAYMYYRYLNMQMEYKIKCKEYEKMTSKDRKTYRISLDFETYSSFLIYCIIFYIIFSSKHLIWKILLLNYMSWIIMWIFISLPVAKLAHSDFVEHF